MIFPIKIIGGAGTNGMPIDVPTAAEMESILSNATAQTAGIIYKYTGTTTDKYINGNLYIVEQSGSAYVFVGLNETVAVQYNLTNCSVAPAPQVTAVGQPFGLNITADSGYKIDDNSTLTVTMGGATVTQTDKNKVYIASVSGNIIITASATVAALAAPTITLSGSVISWAAVSNATAYRIIATADVAKQTDTTSTSFDLSTWSDLTAGTWTIRVLSTNGTVYSDSSNTVTYIIQNKLATPTITIDGDTLNITDVENAQKYKIYANGELKTTIQKAVQPFTLTLNYKSDIGLFNYGRVKIGSVPTSEDDYDYQAVDGHIENKAGSNLGTTVTVENVLKYYTWTAWANPGSTDWQAAVEHTEQSYDLCYTVCLTGDTLVTMADNSVKRLDMIELGDYVLSFDFDSKMLIPRKVIYTDKNEMKSHTEYDKWTFEDGTEIKTVHRHEFYNLEAQRMKYMDEWSVGEHTYKIDGTTPKLISHKIVEEIVRHYKITLEGSTNYFANGLLTGDRNCPKNITLNILCNEKGE